IGSALKLNSKLRDEIEQGLFPSVRLAYLAAPTISVTIRPRNRKGFLRLLKRHQTHRDKSLGAPPELYDTSQRQTDLTTTANFQCCFCTSPLPRHQHRQRHKTQHKNKHRDSRENIPFAVKLLPLIQQRRMTKTNREQQHRPHDPTWPEKIPERYEQQRHSQ